MAKVPESGDGAGEKPKPRPSNRRPGSESGSTPPANPQKARPPAKPSAPAGEDTASNAGKARPKKVSRPAAAKSTRSADGNNPFQSEAASPFGGGEDFTPRVTSRYVQPGMSKSNRWAAIAVTVVVLGGVGWYAFVLWGLGQANRGGSPKATAGGYQNLGRAYYFEPPSGLWVGTTSETEREFELAFHRRDLDGLIKIRTREVQQPVSEGQLADEVRADWEGRVARLEDFSTKPTSVTGRPALEVTAVDPADGRRLQAIVLVVGKFLYWLEFSAPRDGNDSLAADFAKAREQFKILPGADAETDASPATPTSTFAGKRLTYSIAVPQKGWRENPELPAGGRFADLKLVAPDKDVTFIVCARPAEDMDLVEKLYLRRLEHYSQGVKVKPSKDQRTVSGFPATILQAMVTQPDGEYLVSTTFVRGRRNVFWLESRVPASKSADYASLFDQMVDSFRVIDETERPRKTVLASAAQSPSSTPVAKNRDEEKSETDDGDRGEKPAKEEPAGEAKSKAEEVMPVVSQPPSPQPAAKSPTMIDQNFKTLDDLD
ncbi:MAG: hypothetical protein U1D30_26345 [Planctomycetota bacterium]